MRIAVNGGTGFVGSHLIDELVKRGHSVRCFGRGPVENAGRLRAHQGNAQFSYQRVSPEDLSYEHVDSLDAFVHLSAQPDVPFATASPRYTLSVNVANVLHALEVLRRHPTRFVLLSSDQVYGRVVERDLPVTEDAVLRPKNLYGASKAAAELLAGSFAQTHGTRVTILRSVALFGPNASNPNQAIPRFIRKALSGEEIAVDGAGLQTRDFNYVTNLVDTIVRAVEQDVSGTFNVGSGVERTILEAARTIVAATHSSSRIVQGPKRIGEDSRFCVSIDRARKDLDYTPRVSFEDGLRRTIDWMKRADLPPQTS